MAFFNRTALQGTGEYLRYDGRVESPAGDIANQAEAIQYASARRIKSAIDAKRIFDISIAVISLVLLFPVIAAVAAAVKLDSRGPVFFKQERIGLNKRREDRRRRRSAVSMDVRTGIERRRSINPGRPFEIYKFRTMIKDAEKGVPTLACDNDPRITRVGRVLRKTRIDEIPQFINVIKGDMSIIGPRPERSFFINQVKREMPEFTMRLMVKPGITGLAQVEHGYTQTIGEMKGKLFYDLKYIANLSAAQEIKILFKTLQVVVTGKGAC
ncbi:MAG: sugar transferase [Candidatus Krumholzibacteria bacterium]|nr:sugar transferase [Candidatus Krumholzibacteria bacterium]